MKASMKVRHLLALIALACLLFMWGLGSIGLTDRDEGRNAEAGREMFETGDWITPTFNYEPRFIKPAMLYWLMSGSFSVFGQNEFAARFPSAFFGVGLIVVLYMFLLRVRDQTTALYGAIMLLINVEMICLARIALTDMVLIFFTTLATLAFWMGFHGPESRRRWLWLAYAAMACGTLTKGPVGFLVPLLAILPYLAVTRQWRRFWQAGRPLAGLATFLAIALPWYATMWFLHGSAFSSDAQLHTVSRFLNPFYGWGGTVLFYFPVLAGGFFPWSAFLPVALYQALTPWREKVRPSPGDGLADELELFAALWFAAVLVFFSLGATRLPHYIGPIYPSAAIVTACYWTRVTRTSTARGLKIALYVLMGLGVFLAFAFAVLPSAVSAFADKLAKNFPYITEFRFDSSAYVIAGILFFGVALIGWWGFVVSRPARVFWVAGGTMALVLLIVLHRLLPQLSGYFLDPPQVLASRARAQLNPEDHLVIYGLDRPSVVFYARRKVIVVHKNEEENIRRYLQTSHRTMIILPAGLRERLPPEAGALPVIGERYGWILVASPPMR
jgi:4-amino-4-deoxy-L-arabinose transferase-like glycosyltransferase